MKSNGIFVVGLCVLGSIAATSQGQAQSTSKRSFQAAQDPGEPAVLATCKNPPPPRQGPPPGQGQPIQGPRDYAVTEIPGVVAAGQKWTLFWHTTGNDADGFIATPDGGLLIAQNDNSKVVKLDKAGKESVVYSDTHTGGALSRNAKGTLFINERGLKARIEELAPTRKILADRFQGDSLDCIGGVLNDLMADNKGGVYFTMGGLFYVSPSGQVTSYGKDLRTNGIILSPDEKTLYVTNGPTLAAFDVQPDGSLTNQREFAKLEAGGNGDGSAVDDAGRIYVTSSPGVQVFSPEGKYLGLIPTPRPLISVAFSGPGKKTLYAISFYRVAPGTKDANGEEVTNEDEIYSIPMLATGIKSRAK